MGYIMKQKDTDYPFEETAEGNRKRKAKAEDGG